MDVARTPAIRRPVRIVTVIGFLAFISVPLLLTFAGVRPGADDNRKPSARPALGARELVDEQTYQQMDRYLQDSFALRGLAVRINAKLNDKVWKGDTDQVRRGKGDWLYYGPSLSQLCTEAMRPAEGVAMLERFAVHHRGAGRPLHLHAGAREVVDLPRVPHRPADDRRAVRVRCPGRDPRRPGRPALVRRPLRRRSTN